MGWCSVRARRGGLGAGWVTLPPSTLTVGVLRRFFESVLTRGFSGFVIKSQYSKLTYLKRVWLGLSVANHQGEDALGRKEEQ